MKLNKTFRNKLIAIFAIFAIFTSLAFSMTSAAKSLGDFSENLLSNLNPIVPEPTPPKRFGGSESSRQTDASEKDSDENANEKNKDNEEDDADLPRFMIGKIKKEDYFNRRDEHINRLRGIEKGKPFDAGARGRAVKKLDQQQGLPDKNTMTIRLTDEDGVSYGAEISTGGVLSPLAANVMPNNSSWVSVGPAPIPNGQTFGVQHAVSGRVTSIAVHPTNSDIAYVAAAQGGVYRTLDGGATWTAIFDNAQTLAVGAIAISPSQPSTIYIGTGEGNFSCDSYFGVGVYRIDNADGSTPTLTGPFAKDVSNTDVLTGRSISKVVVHPTNPDIIFIGVTNGIGGMGCDGTNASGALSNFSNRGLYRSTNATSSNATFEKLTTATANGGNRSVTDIEFEPGNPNTLLATVVGFSTANDGGVYRSTNALAVTPTFTQTLSVGSGTATARVELAVNKVGGTTTVYAGISDSSGTLKRSVDGGVTWSAALSNATGYCSTQCTYDMPIAVDPTNANVLYIGGNADGTSSAIIKKSTNAAGATPTFTKVQNGLHADSHAIEIDPSDNNTVWFGSDGGVWKSTNAAGTWISLNNTGLNATQFQSLALHPTDPNYMIGGTQDNGTERMKPDGTWTRTDFGDGGFALIDQNAANTTTVRQYHTYFNQVGANPLVAFATSTSSTAFENWTALGCGGTANGLSCNDTAVAFYAPMALGPGNPNTLYFGTDRLYRSSNSGTTMTVVAPQFASGVAVTAIGISPQNDAVRIVGLRNGKVFSTITGGATSATMADVTGTIPAKYVSRAVIDPNNQNTAYVTLAGYFGNAGSHIYKTTNLNAAAPTWTGIDGGQIPDVPVNAFVVDPIDSNTLYAGTDIGVYRSTDGGTTWAAFSDGLPRVAVFDMAIQNASRKLRIATHGRGMWEISIAATPAVIKGTVTDASTNAPIMNAKVTAGSNSTTTDENGFYQFSSIPSGTYDMTASAIGYTNGNASGVTASNGSVTTKDFTLANAPASACNTDTSQADFAAGMPSNVDATTAPGDVKLSLPGVVTESQTSLAFFVDSITATTWQSQTFVAPSSGLLNQVDFQAALSSAATSGAVAVEIQNTVSGAPGGTVLATTNLTSISGTGNAWYTVTFATPASVNAGTSYAIVLRAASGGPYRAVRANGNVYANGAWYQSTTSGSSWALVTSAGITQDLAFRAYVQPLAYANNGNLVSSPKDANQADGTMAGWSTISWNATTSANTAIKFQAAGSNNYGGLYTFIGPDGTPSTYFNSGDSLAQFNGFRYLKYKAYLSTTDSSITPTLNDVTVCNSNIPLPATTVEVLPAKGTYGGTANLSAKLTSGGNPVAGKTIVFKFNGSNFTGNSVVTDSNGEATIQDFSLAGINAGIYPNYISVKFASDSAYAGSNGSNALEVEKATPTVTWTNPADITYGTALSADQLNATASVPGSFVYTPALNAVLNAGNNQTLSLEFTPTDETNYNKVLKEVFINVLKTSSNTVVTVNNAVYDGNAHGATAVATGFGGLEQALTVTYSGRNGTNYGPSTVAPTNAGDYTASATFDGDSDHNSSSDSKDYSIAKADVTINWSNPSDIVYGTALSAAQLNATASVPGSFVYNPAIGKVLAVGDSQTLHADFTATDTGNYNSASKDVSINVKKALLTVTAEDKSRAFGVTNPTLTYKMTGFVNGDTQASSTSGQPAITTTATSTSAPGDYTITIEKGSLASDNYDFSFTNGILTVKKADQTITFGALSNKTYGNLPFAVSASGGGSGNAVTFSASGNCTSSGTNGSTITITGAGSCLVTASQLGNASYNAAQNVSQSFSIAKASLTITAKNASKQYSDPMPEFGVDYSGFVLNETGSVLSGTIGFVTSPVATALSPAGIYSIIPSGLSSSNYAIAYSNGLLTVVQEKATLTYSGDSLVSTSKSDATTTVNLAALVQEEVDGNLGNTLAGKTVKFSIYKSNNTSMASADYTVLSTIAYANGIATAKGSVTLPSDNYTVKMELISNNQYVAEVETALFTVVDPGTGRTSGGGTVIEENGGRGNFAFTMKYVPSGNPQGNNMYISRMKADLSAYGAPSGQRNYNIIFKSNAMSAMQSNASSNPKTAQFTGKNTIKAVDRLTGLTYDITGGVKYNFQVNVTDKNNPSSSANPDTYAFRAWSSTGNFKVVGSYLASGANSSQVALNGGNIQIK